MRSDEVWPGGLSRQSVDLTAVPDLVSFVQARFVPTVRECASRKKTTGFGRCVRYLARIWAR